MRPGCILVMWGCVLEIWSFPNFQKVLKVQMFHMEHYGNDLSLKTFPVYPIHGK